MEKRSLLIIHGLRSNKRMYKPLIKSLSKDFDCIHFEYKVKNTVPDIVYNLREFIFHNSNLASSYVGSTSFDVITYSFGAIIFRNYLGKYGEKSVGRVLMAVPTNHGSELLRTAMNTRLGRYALGTLGKDYIEHESAYLAPEPKYVEVGVVAGNKPEPVRRFPGLSGLFSKHKLEGVASDGKVKIEETKLPRMKDFTTIEAYHDEVAYNPKFFQLAHNFLQMGSFAG